MYIVFGPSEHLLLVSINHAVMANFPLMKFLELLQDYCLHLCFSGYQDSKTSLHGIASHREGSHHTHLMLRPPSHLEENSGMTSCKLYHSHSVVSAVLNAKQLVVSAGRRIAGGALPPSKPTGVTLNKEDNSGIAHCHYVSSEHDVFGIY